MSSPAPKDNAGLPAFATHESSHLNGAGLTKREYIAIQAMAALISRGLDDNRGKSGVPVIARYACEYADALLLELSK